MTSSVNSLQWGKEIIKQIEVYSSLDSSNTFAKERIQQGAKPGTVIWALEQMNGRGRQGRRWDSDQGSLTFSVIWQDLSLQRGQLLPLTVGLGLIMNMQPLAPNLKLKWPNDLWVGQRKMGGILGERFKHQGQDWTILGVGLNVNSLPEDYVSQRTSLQTITKQKWSRLGILNLALVGLEYGYNLMQQPTINLGPLFERYGNFLGKEIIIYQGQSSWTGKALSVLNDGRLLIEDAQGVRALMPDEISLRF